METGSITSSIDVAQLTLYLFWLFFAGLIYYLRREDKREGYPLESDRSARIRVEGFPAVPAPKKFVLAHGETRYAPSAPVAAAPIAAKPVGPWLGAPLEPTGNPMLAGVGPGSYAAREDAPALTEDGHPAIVPMRVATDFSIAPQDPDPRGMLVIGADKRIAGVVRDMWVDRTEPQIRYYEVEVPAGASQRRVLLPSNFTRVNKRRGELQVKAVLASQLADVPALSNPDQITLLEEERIVAYYGGGYLYATPERTEPWF
jgi:photosynthetic reaction center H subunit